MKSAATKWLLITVLVGLTAAGGWWLYKEATKPLPGQEVSDMGANHVTDISGVLYNSDPPTSGPHFSIWAKKGVYDRVISDGHLIHSLEHGYVVASYNCDQLKAQMSNVKTEEGIATDSAKPLSRMAVGVSGTRSFFTPDNPPPVEVELPESFKSDECKNLVDQLDNFLKDYQRLIIVPRPTLDSLVALTAWGRIDKLSLTSYNLTSYKMEKFDHNRIKDFIDAYHNKGPEKTQE